VSGETSASSGAPGSGATASGGDAAAGADGDPSAAGSDGGVVERPYCDGDSADLSTDVFNCGECGNVCQPDVLASGLHAPESVIADSNYVYWAERIADGRVFQLPLGGATTNRPPVIASNQQNPHSLVVDATNVYWITTDGVWMRPISGGKAVSIATEPGNRSPGDLTLDGTSLYWTTHRDAAASPAVVNKMPLGGGSAVEVTALAVTDLRNIAVDSTSVFFVHTEHDGSLGSSRHDEVIYKAPLEGGSAVELYRFSYGFINIWDMATDASYLYLALRESPPSITPNLFSETRVMRLPLEGGEPETLVTALQQWYAGFGINAQGVFLASNNGNIVGGTLRFAPSGIGTPFSLGWGVQPTSLGVTETHLYLTVWEDNGLDEGAVYRMGLCVNSACQ